MSQPDFLYELFEDFMDDPANQVFSMDNGLVCRWMTGQAKIASTACVMTQAKSPTLSYRLCYNLPWVVTPKIELHTKQTVVKTEHFTAVFLYPNLERTWHNGKPKPHPSGAILSQR